MPSVDSKISEFDQYQKSDKTALIIYANLEYLIKKIDGCKNNPENSSTTTKVSENIPSVFSMSTISLFRSIENKRDVCRGKVRDHGQYTRNKGAEMQTEVQRIVYVI